MLSYHTFTQQDQGFRPAFTLRQASLDSHVGDPLPYGAFMSVALQRYQPISLRGRRSVVYPRNIH